MPSCLLAVMSLKMASRSAKMVLPAELLSKVVTPIYSYTASCCTGISRCSRQAALERQDLSCIYLNHHELKSVIVMFIFIIIIIIFIIFVFVFIVYYYIIYVCFVYYVVQGTGMPDAFSTAELQEKHPELKKMCAQEWRKHYRSLKTDAERQEARAQRPKQAAEKAQIISKHQAQQRQEKKKESSSNVTAKYADGEQKLFLGLYHRMQVCFWYISGILLNYFRYSGVQRTYESFCFVLYASEHQ